MIPGAPTRSLQALDLGSSEPGLWSIDVQPTTGRISKLEEASAFLRMAEPGELSYRSEAS